ncbi:hypothetical protein K1W54_29805 [Micromonospora sp. CPCC 205371]|nr:hypothetical protein [Micromonospora sp. CPCC 205371]
MSRLSVESPLALVEVCPNPAVDHPGTVGLIAASRDGKGWTKLTPEEARRVADDLQRAADEVEGLNE